MPRDRLALGPRWPHLANGILMLVVGPTFLCVGLSSSGDALMVPFGVIAVLLAWRVLSVRVVAQAGSGIRIRNVLKWYRISWSDCDSFYEGYLDRGFNLAFGLPGRVVIVRTRTHGEIEITATQCASGLDYRSGAPDALLTRDWTEELNVMLRENSPTVP